MIISASRRTDIPAYYSAWLLNRLKEGYVLIPNPRNPGRLGRVSLSADNVDCIVFWTKNPIPMLDRLKTLDHMGYRYYMQFTLTPYGAAMETKLPPKAELMQAFVALSRQIGAKRTVWRYDPVIIDKAHSIDWHLARFLDMCEALQTHTERCVISFIDPYKSTGDLFRAMTPQEMTSIASGFSAIAQKHGIALFTCAEEIDLSMYGVAHASCIDKLLIEQIIGSRIEAKRDANQRAACRCIESVDIGAYDTCAHGCRYCYATTGANAVTRRMAAHDPLGPMLTGYPRGDELVTDRTAPSRIIHQLSMFQIQ